VPDEPSIPFSEWIGRENATEDQVTERLVASYRAIFEPHLAPVAEGLAPLGIHWCLSPSIATMSELGPDGHPAKNRDMPPVPQPRRMWAGGSLEISDALRIGDRVRRFSTIRDVTRKEGKSGELWFVGVDQEYATQRGVAIRERLDIVYRQAATRALPEPAAAPPRPFSRSLSVDTPPALLFRYSAITFNGHRIHYDLPYATEVEGYRGLVVHGPIQATLLYNLAAAAGGPPRKFDYRGVSPAIGGDGLLVRAGKGDEVERFWTQGPAGQIHMEATAARS